MSSTELLRCYNKSCGNEYKEDENSEDCCLHHPGVPVFHDALKGCTRSRHSNVKPPEPQAPKNNEKPLGLNEEIKVEIRKPQPKEPSQRPSDELPMTKLKKTVTSSLKTALAKVQESGVQAANDKGEDGNEVKPGTTCKNSGCTMTYKNEGSNDDKCWFHEGVPIFHEGYKFWSCCQKRTSDFDEFLKQEGCMSGTHRWVLTDEEKQKRVLCRYDWYQMGNHVVIPVFAKLCNPEESYVQANNTKLHAHIVFGDSNIFELDLTLHGVIIPEKSSVTLSQPKVEIKLLKADVAGWSSLDLKQEKREETSQDDSS